jgi:mannose-6-phosphate isomerase-like protein (cupin superfamily)
MQISRLDQLDPFTTLDGSTVRELTGASSARAENQSLAEAVVPAGGETDEHFHRRAEEIYFFTSGAGRMRLRDEEVDVREGDCVVIPPGASHKLWNAGPAPLALLCCSSPPYSHEDTVVTESS